MTEAFDALRLISLLEKAAAGLTDHGDRLTELDAIMGDGDMGVTAELVSRAIARCRSSSAEDDIGKLLVNCGMEINRGSPSTFGTLLASASVEAGRAVLGQKRIEVGDFAVLGRGAIAGVRKRGKSDVGEKTLLDSLVPAVEAFEQALAKGVDYKVTIETAIRAAKEGVAKTTSMGAAHGRAAYRQDRGVGVQDAGATAMFYLIESFGSALIDYLEKQPNSVS